jgi:hypothetical protein
LKSNALSSSFEKIKSIFSLGVEHIGIFYNGKPPEPDSVKVSFLRHCWIHFVNFFQTVSLPMYSTLALNSGSSCLSLQCARTQACATMPSYILIIFY